MAANTFSILVRESLVKAFDYPIDLVGKRFSSLTLGGNNVEVRQWPTTSKTKELEDALKEIDSLYNPNLSFMNDLKKMPRITKILNSTEHCI